MRAVRLVAALALAAPCGCASPDRGELTYACTPDGETAPRYLLTKADRADGLALGAVQDLADGRWLAVGRPVPLSADEATWLAGDDAFVVARRTGDLTVLDRARGGLKLRAECDRVPFVPAPEQPSAVR